jgi:hypothetical protein
MLHSGKAKQTVGMGKRKHGITEYRSFSIRAWLACSDDQIIG